MKPACEHRVVSTPCPLEGNSVPAVIGAGEDVVRGAQCLGNPVSCHFTSTSLQCSLAQRRHASRQQAGSVVHCTVVVDVKTSDLNARLNLVLVGCPLVSSTFSSFASAGPMLLLLLLLL